MKLQYSFEIVDMGEEYIAVPIGNHADKLHGVLKLNKEGKEILELLKEEMSEEDVVTILFDKYEIEHDVLMSYVEEFVEKLKEQEIVTI